MQSISSNFEFQVESELKSERFTFLKFAQRFRIMHKH